MQRILQDLYRKMYWVFADANFSGGWAQSDADNAENVMYKICNNVHRMSRNMVHSGTNRNKFKYHRSGIYRIEPGDAQSDTILWHWWRKYILSSIYIFQIQKYFFNYLRTINSVFLLQFRTTYQQEQNISSLSIIIYEVFIEEDYLDMLYWYTRTNIGHFHEDIWRKHYLSIHKENCLDDD